MPGTSLKSQEKITIIVTALILLYFYTATSKLLDIQEFKRQLSNQTLPVWSVSTLQWLIPLSELLVCGLLIAGPTCKIGLYGSSVLMFFFTAYMGLVLANVFHKVPCSCGGVIRYMGFKEHFLFNLFFLTLSIVGIFIFKQKRKGGPVATSDL